MHPLIYISRPGGQNTIFTEWSKNSSNVGSGPELPKDKFKSGSFFYGHSSRVIHRICICTYSTIFSSTIWNLFDKCSLSLGHNFRESIWVHAQSYEISLQSQIAVKMWYYHHIIHYSHVLPSTPSLTPTWWLYFPLDLSLNLESWQPPSRAYSSSPAKTRERQRE